MTRRRIPLIVVSVALVLIAVGIGLSWTSDAARNERERQASVAAALENGGLGSRGAVLGVDAVQIDPSESRVIVDLAVILAAVRTVAVGAEVAGRVVEVGVEEHHSVDHGAVLIRLDPALPQAAVERARASLLRARSASELATQEHGRQQSLSGQGIGSDAEFDRTCVLRIFRRHREDWAAVQMPSSADRVGQAPARSVHRHAFRAALPVP